MRSTSSKKTDGRPKRRNLVVALVALAAVMGVAGCGGKDKASSGSSGGAVTSVSEVRSLLSGIPQKGNVLGKPNAPVTMYEYVDYQCPFCRQFSTGPLRTVIKDYVRTGNVKLIAQTLSFVGPDSVKAARAAAAAGQQNKQWEFTELWYFNQGQENSGYATDGFVDKIYDAAGVSKAQANAYRKTEASKRPLAAADSGAQQYAVDSTPSFVLGLTGGPYEKVAANPGNAASLKAAIDTLLQQ